MATDRFISRHLRVDNREGARWRWFWAVAFLLVFAAAAIPRLIELGRSLWESEVWVANSILADLEIDAFHKNILKDPQVGVLAKMLGEIIEKTQAGLGGNV